MSAPVKRSSNQISENEQCVETTEKKPRQDSGLEKENEKLKNFLDWCEANDFKLSSKVKVGRCGSVAEYGMVAEEDLPEGFQLFQVPRRCLLMPQNSHIAVPLTENNEDFSDDNPWIPLLLSLIAEQNNPNSLWRPYLDLVPDFSTLDLPLFWESSEVKKLLKNTGVDSNVTRDNERIDNDYKQFVEPFFKDKCSLSNDKNGVNLELFRKMVAFVMAYSFTEPEDEGIESGSSDNNQDDAEEPQMKPPMMVPMADMLNHVTDNNAKLTFGESELKMVTTRPIKKGQEVFNTYGQVSNLHLMHMYGFAEQYPANTNDVVEIPPSTLLQAAKELKISNNNSDIIDKKWEFLKDINVLENDEMIILGTQGILNDEICRDILKVLCMSESEFADHQEKEGWSDAETDASLSGESALSFEKIVSIDPKWKKLLLRMSKIHLSCYPTSVSQDKEKLESDNATQRERYTIYLSLGQKYLLQKLQKYIKKNPVSSPSNSQHQGFRIQC